MQRIRGTLNPGLYFGVWLCWLSSMGGFPARPALAQALPRSLAPSETSPTRIPTNNKGEVDPNFVNQILSILNDAVITRLDAQVSLESAKVQNGRVRLEGLRLRNFNLGLRLNAGAAKRLAEAFQNHYAAQDASRGASAAASANSLPIAPAKPSQNQLTQVLEILKLGLFNRLEFSIHLSELNIKRLALDTDALDVEGLLLKVGATPNDPVTGKPRNDTLAILIDILRQTALTHIKAHAGLDKLSARRVNLDLEGTSLEGLSITVALLRVDNATT